MKNYIIKIWETEDLRDAGISNIIDSNILNLEDAIIKAKKIMENNNFASLEVQTSDEMNSIYFCTSKEEEYLYEFNSLDINENIEDIVDLYFIQNKLNNFMDYGSDADIIRMPSLSEFYKDILDKLKIQYLNIFTEDVSDGKYSTTIEFDDNNKIIIDTSAWNGKDVAKDNIKSIQEQYVELQVQNEDDMEM